MSELEQNQVIRRALEAAAAKVEQQGGNAAYLAAYKIAARIIRGLKPD